MNRVVVSWKSTSAFAMPQGNFVLHGHGRRALYCDEALFRTESFAAFGLKYLHQEIKLQTFIGNHYCDGAHTQIHKDIAPKEFVHTRCNWMIKKPPVGGDPILGGKVIPVNEGDLWICFASEEPHGSTPIAGGERIVCSFGALIPNALVHNVMEQIT